MGAFRLKFGTVALVLQTVFIVLFATLTEYDWRAHPVYSDPNHPLYSNDTSEAYKDSSEPTSFYVGRKYPRK